MSKCKYETSNGKCGMKDCYAYRHKCYTKEFCKCHQPMTNEDRIRAMSDEELAEYLAELGSEANNGVIYSDRPEEWLEWLQQPAEK